MILFGRLWAVDGGRKTEDGRTVRAVARLKNVILRKAQDGRECRNLLKNAAHGELVEP